MRLRQILIEHLKQKSPNWVHGGELEDVAKENHYEGETAKRRLREITQSTHRSFNPNIEQVLKNGCVMYRFNAFIAPNQEKTQILVFGRKNEIGCQRITKTVSPDADTPKHLSSRGFKTNGTIQTKNTFMTYPEKLTSCPVCGKKFLTRSIKCHITGIAIQELARVAKNLLDSAKNKPYTFSSGVANRQCPHHRYIKKHLKEFKKFTI